MIPTNYLRQVPIFEAGHDGYYTDSHYVHPKADGPVTGYQLQQWWSKFAFTEWEPGHDKGEWRDVAILPSEGR